MSRVFQKWLDLKGRRIRYLESGDGFPSVVLLHGGSCDSAGLSWRKVLPDLGGTCHVLAPDLPGFGQSDPLKLPCTAQGLINFVRQFLDELGLQTVVLAGLSLGGLVSLGLSLSHPTRVQALVLVASAGLKQKIRWDRTARIVSRVPSVHQGLLRAVSLSRFGLRKSLELFIHNPKAVDEALVSEVEQALRRKGSGEAWRSFLASEVGRDGFQTHYQAKLNRLSVPVLLLHGNEDRLVPVEHSHYAHEEIAGSALRIFEGCGHWLPREKPEEFCREVVSYLDRWIVPGSPA